jgi:hypothetical protein
MIVASVSVAHSLEDTGRFATVVWCDAVNVFALAIVTSIEIVSLKSQLLLSVNLNKHTHPYMTVLIVFDYRLCVQVVRVPGCRNRGPWFDFWRHQILWVAVGPERGPLSLVRINEELLERKVTAPLYKTEISGRGGSAALIKRHPSIRKSWH